MPRIQITRPQEASQKFSLPDDLVAAVSIGRSEECDICLYDPSISDLHASLELADGHYYLVDQQSTNGILLNGERVDNILLIPNVEVFLGEVSFVLLSPKEEETPIPVISQPAAPAPAPSYPSAHFTSSAAPVVPVVPAPVASGGGFKRRLLMFIYLVVIAVLACLAGTTYRHYEMTGKFLPMQLLHMDGVEANKAVPTDK